MKNWIIVGLVAGSAQNLVANGSSFGAGFAGGLFGGMVGGALTQPRYREVTYVEQSPEPLYYYRQREAELDRREARLRRLEERLEAQAALGGEAVYFDDEL